MRGARQLPAIAAVPVAERHDGVVAKAVGLADLLYLYTCPSANQSHSAGRGGVRAHMPSTRPREVATHLQSRILLLQYSTVLTIVLFNMVLMQLILVKSNVGVIVQ